MTVITKQKTAFDFPTYGIEKPGYQCNPEITYDKGDAREYWTGKRLALNGRYQFDVYRYAARLASKRHASSLLDLGSGPAVKVKKLLRQQIDRIVLADQPNTREIAIANVPEASFVPIDLNAPHGTLDASPFDLIICADVIEHVSRPDAILETIKNNLARDGRFIISTPNRDIRRGETNLRPTNPVHVREWNLQEFRAFVENAGFDVLEQFSVPIIKLNPLQSAYNMFTRSHNPHPIFAGGQLLVGKSQLVN